MASFLIPTELDSPRYQIGITLDKVKFLFDFEWNDRDSSWYMSLSDANEVPLISGRRVTIGYPLLTRYRTPNLPAGLLEAIDTSGQAVDPGYADLGARVILMYTESADVAAALAG